MPPIPNSFAFLPPCPIHALTGLLCPGCGGTHCLLALLHADLRTAWHQNALLTLLLPAAVLLLVLEIACAMRDLPSPVTRLSHSRPLLWTLAITTAAFTILRNLA